MGRRRRGAKRAPQEESICFPLRPRNEKIAQYALRNCNECKCEKARVLMIFKDREILSFVACPSYLQEMENLADMLPVMSFMLAGPMKPGQRSINVWSSWRYYVYKNKNGLCGAFRVEDSAETTYMKVLERCSAADSEEDSEEDSEDSVWVDEHPKQFLFAVIDEMVKKYETCGSEEAEKYMEQLLSCNLEDLEGQIENKMEDYKREDVPKIRITM